MYHYKHPLLEVFPLPCQCSAFYTFGVCESIILFVVSKPLCTFFKITITIYTHFCLAQYHSYYFPSMKCFQRTTNKNHGETEDLYKNNTPIYLQKILIYQTLKCKIDM